MRQRSVDAAGAGRPLQNVALDGYGDLVSLVRVHEGRLLAIAPDIATAGGVDPALVYPDGPVACFVAGSAAQGMSSGWQQIAIAAESVCSLVEALDLEPGRILVIRPDLHSAGNIVPASLASLLACYRGQAVGSPAAAGPGAGRRAVAAGEKA